MIAIVVLSFILFLSFLELREVVLESRAYTRLCNMLKTKGI